MVELGIQNILKIFARPTIKENNQTKF